MGDLGRFSSPHLACTYWTGRDLKTKVVAYSPSNFMGRDSCQFLVQP